VGDVCRLPSRQFAVCAWVSFAHALACDLGSSLTCGTNSVRALGETDLNPVSGLGKISQLLFAVLQPGNVVANIVAGT
jgi:hypothetical protein